MISKVHLIDDKEPRPIDINGQTDKAIKLFEEGHLYKEKNGWLSLAEMALAFLLDENERSKERSHIIKEVKKNLKDLYTRIHFCQLDPVNPDSFLTVDDARERNESGLFAEQEPTDVELTWLVRASVADRWLSDYNGISFNPALVEIFDPFHTHKRIDQESRTITESPANHSEHEVTTQKTKSDENNQGNTLKRNKLIEKFKSRWPTIDKDLREASRNKLDSARSLKKGYWHENEALNWAKLNGKIKHEQEVD